MKLKIAALLSLSLAACAPGGSRLAGEISPLVLVDAQLTGGHDREGTNYTAADPASAETLAQLKTKIQSNPTNVDFAQRHSIVVNFLDDKGKQIPFSNEAARIWVLLYVTDDAKQITTYQYQASAKPLHSGELTAVDEASKKFTLTLQCEGENCRERVIKINGQATPQASGSKPKPATIAIQGYDVNSEYNGLVQILVSQPQHEALQKLGDNAELNDMLAKYAKPTTLPSVSYQTLFGRSHALIDIPVLDRKVCLDIELLETRDKASRVSIRCGQEFFSEGELLGNSRSGWLALSLTHSSKLKLMLELKLAPLAPEILDNPAPNLQLTVNANELEHAQAQAFLKVNLKGERTAYMYDVLQSEVLSPTQKNMIEQELNHLRRGARQAQVQAFFKSQLARHPAILNAYAKLDVPSDLGLNTLIEMHNFFIDGKSIAGPVDESTGDCPIGPEQFMSATASGVIAHGRLDFHNFKILPTQIENGKCSGQYYADHGDSRTDYVKAQQLAAAYFAELSDTLKGAVGRGQKVVDPRVILAAFNAGPGRVNRGYFHTVDHDSQRQDAKALYETHGRNLKRLFELAGVYPDIWRLCALNALRPETCNYTKTWTALRMINQSPETYGFSINREPPSPK